MTKPSRFVISEDEHKRLWEAQVKRDVAAANAIDKRYPGLKLTKTNGYASDELLKAMLIAQAHGAVWRSVVELIRDGRKVEKTKTPVTRGYY
jgi:hypothetical protein